MEKFNDFNEKLNIVIEQLKELSSNNSIMDKRLSRIENAECVFCLRNNKEEIANPFTWHYIKRKVLTKKYLFTVALKMITKTLVLAFLTIFFFDLWNPLIESIKVRMPWNNLNRKHFFGENVKLLIKKIFNIETSVGD